MKADIEKGMHETIKEILRGVNAVAKDTIEKDFESVLRYDDPHDFILDLVKFLKREQDSKR